MSKVSKLHYRAASEKKERVAVPFVQSGIGKLSLLLLSVLLLTLAYAPVKQFYLAWIGLVPWLWVASQSKTRWQAFWWTTLAGTLYYSANLWWLAYVSGIGTVALMLFLGLLYWGTVALVLRGAGWLEVPNSVRGNVIAVAGIATVWVTFEWLRGVLFTGFPWLFLGHTQSPILIVCQIADVCGVYGVTFLVVAVNALVFLYVRGADRKSLRPAAIMVASMWIASAVYGLLRAMPQMSLGGLSVLLVQSNYPQSNKGEKGASEYERVKFHLDATADAIRKAGNVDLTCWSETLLPSINEEHRGAWRGHSLGDIPDYGAFLDDIVARASNLAHDYHTNILSGGVFCTDLDERHGIFRDRRNAAFLFRRDGSLAAEHYDKIHLVPFGEFMPFKNTPGLRWLYRFFMSFSPYDYDYTLTAGSDTSPVIFTVVSERNQQAVRLLSPICFEDVDAGLLARMLRGDGAKRADLLVNLTNDGWFSGSQNPQHLQASIFRAIENRVPLVRSVNTGISGFVDSYGRVSNKIAMGTEGTAVQWVWLDSRYTFYTRFGDVFAGLLATATGWVIVRSYVRFRRNRHGTAS